MKYRDLQAISYKRITRVRAIVLIKLEVFKVKGESLTFGILVHAPARYLLLRLIFAPTLNSIKEYISKKVYIR